MASAKLSPSKNSLRCCRIFTPTDPIEISDFTANLGGYYSYDTALERTFVVCTISSPWTDSTRAQHYRRVNQSRSLCPRVSVARGSERRPLQAQRSEVIGVPIAEFLQRVRVAL